MVEFEAGVQLLMRDKMALLDFMSSGGKGEEHIEAAKERYKQAAEVAGAIAVTCEDDEFRRMDEEAALRIEHVADTLDAVGSGYV